MVDTIIMQDLNNYAESVYEAIIMIARRARQINDEQKQLFEKEYYDEESDDFLEDEYEREEKNIVEMNLPKPHTIALEEFQAGEIVKLELNDDAQ
ncbi:MAG: DNA-directed RNA polymerase subunit omega [Deferribacteres bacterium]|nr:DNA-directed RNA polymerase subunit omega [candidate division KSB1 bacterium]MCB9501489.1 DNA-directed RNA polymerase subunit omega [Deferribacteres bacterium]